MKEIADKLLEAINSKIEDEQEDGRRDHLGASLIGRECLRELYYTWRWATDRKFDARMIRLFNRGHLEEDRFIEWLKGVCDEVWPIDPRTGKQIRIEEFKGYFGGSLDAVIQNPAGYKGNFLGEFKTHNDASYKKVTMKGVREAKPEHYTQMQIYLYYKPRLVGALYFAINKNDDSLYIEFVGRDEDEAIRSLNKAKTVLLSPEPPARFDAASEYNFYCNKFCDHGSVCWKNKAPAVSCRTCTFVKPTDEGWKCTKHEVILDSQAQRDGCKEYERLF